MDQIIPESLYFQAGGHTMEELLSASYQDYSLLLFLILRYLWNTVFLYSSIVWHLGAHPFIRPLLTTKCVLSVVDSEYDKCPDVSMFYFIWNSLDSLFCVMSNVAVHQLVSVHLHQVQHGQGPEMLD